MTRGTWLIVRHTKGFKRCVDNVMRRPIYRVVLSLTMIFAGLFGCALEPQQITIEPKFYVARENVGNQRPIRLRAVDARSKQELGSRGFNSGKSTLSVANDFIENVSVGGQQALRQLGFMVTEDSMAPVQFTIMVKQLDYEVSEAAVIYDISLNAKVEIAVSHKGRLFRAVYRTHSNNKFAAPPSLEKNHQLVNQVLSRALTNAFNDPELRAFLLIR